MLIIYVEVTYMKIIYGLICLAFIISLIFIAVNRGAGRLQNSQIGVDTWIDMKDSNKRFVRPLYIKERMSGGDYSKD